jgi:hypothetical protein
MGFTFRFLKPTDSYYLHWVALRRRRRAAWCLFASSLPMGVLLGVALHHLFGLNGIWAIALSVACATAVAQYLNFTWPCPRCGKPYYWNLWDWRLRLFVDDCRHCELPLYAPDSSY